jgi:hypothetical protein
MTDLSKGDMVDRVFAADCDNCDVSTMRECHKCEGTGLVYRVTGLPKRKQWPGTIDGERLALLAAKEAATMTPEQIAAIKTKSVSVGEKHRTFAHVNDLVEWQVAEITRLTSALEEAEKRGYDTAKEHAANSVFTSIANASVKGNGTNVSRRWLMDLIKTAQADIRAMVKP